MTVLLRESGAYTKSYDADPSARPFESLRVLLRAGSNMTGRANATGTQTLTWNVENQLLPGGAKGISGTPYLYQLIRD